MSAVDVVAVLRSAVQICKEEGWGLNADATQDALAVVSELVDCYDAMLARWWSNASPADKALANRAANARMRFAGESHPTEPPIDEMLGEQRREAAQRNPDAFRCGGQ